MLGWGAIANSAANAYAACQAAQQANAQMAAAYRNAGTGGYSASRWRTSPLMSGDELMRRFHAAMFDSIKSQNRARARTEWGKA